MSKLLKKEMVLTAAPITYIFLLAVLLAFIPDGYPITMSAVFVCMGIFYTFQFSRENNDVLYTALLPVRKGDVVRAKFAFTIFVELVSLALSSVSVIVIMLGLSRITAYGEGVLLNPNFAYLGYLLVIYGLFNAIFLGIHFKTAYNVGMPFVVFIVTAMVAVGISETLHHIPTLGALNLPSFADGWMLQLSVLAFGAVFFAVGTFVSLRSSIRNFEGVDVR